MTLHLQELALLSRWRGGVALLLLAVTPALAANLSLRLRDEQGVALADAVAYLEPVGKSLPKSEQRAQIGQQGKAFIPYVSVVQTGSLVSFPNNDTVRHHVYSFSAAKTFELRLYSGTPTQPVLFDKPGVVVLGCNIHDWMLAYLLVVNTPWFAKSDERGELQIVDAPPGDYQLRLWHPRMSEERVQSLRLPAGSASQQLTLRLDKPDLRSKGG